MSLRTSTLAFGIAALLPTIAAAAEQPASRSPEGPTEEPARPPPAPAPVDPPPAPPAGPAEQGPAPGAAPVTESRLAEALEKVQGFVQLYGTLKPTFITSSAAVESFSQPNAVAVTAAANPVLANQANQARRSFQVAQTRIGIRLLEKQPVRGQLEVDFVDFTKANPTVQAIPRLRIAKVEWAATERVLLAAGQDWDLFSPLNAHGSNFVGSLLQAGNAAFHEATVEAPRLA